LVVWMLLLAIVVRRRAAWCLASALRRYRSRGRTVPRGLAPGPWSLVVWVLLRTSVVRRRVLQCLADTLRRYRSRGRTVL
jgi:hypothetical protein